MKKTQIQLSDHFTYQKLLRFVLPSIVMMVFTSIYGVVDGLFVSNFAGKTPFAAINLVMPFIMVLGGIGFMIGTGGTALVSKILGEGDQEKAKRYFSMMILFTVLVGAVLTAVGVVFMRPAALRADIPLGGTVAVTGLGAVGLCAGISGARFTTTTEVYPDSPRATPQQCNDAQAAAVTFARDWTVVVTDGGEVLVYDGAGALRNRVAPD